MAKPTEEEITKEIETLHGQIDTVRKYSALGDDNRSQIRAQIRVADEDMDEEEIGDAFDGKDQEAATDMRYWLDGDEDISPSASWAPLCKNREK